MTTTEWMVIGIVTLIVMIPIIWGAVYLEKIYQEQVRNAEISNSDDLARTKQGKIRNAKISDSKKNFWNLIQILFMSLLEVGILLSFTEIENFNRFPSIILWWMAWYYILTSKKTVTWKVIALILSMGILGCSAYESTSKIVNFIWIFGTPVFWIVFVGKRIVLAIKIKRQNKEKLNQIRQKKEWIKTWKQPIQLCCITLFLTGLLSVLRMVDSSWLLCVLFFMWLIWFLVAVFYAIDSFGCQCLLTEEDFDKEVLEERKCQNKEKLNQIRQGKEWIKTWKRPVHYFLRILFFTGILPIFQIYVYAWFLKSWRIVITRDILGSSVLFLGWFLFVAFYAIYGLVCQFLFPKYAFDKEVLEDRKTFLLNTSILVWSVELYYLLSRWF